MSRLVEELTDMLPVFDKSQGKGPPQLVPNVERAQHIVGKFSSEALFEELCARGAVAPIATVCLQHNIPAWWDAYHGPGSCKAELAYKATGLPEPNLSGDANAS
jgi:hypothetical protein